MRRIIALTTTVVLMLVAFAPAALAQYDEHPIVGPWIIDTTTDDPTDQLSLDSFSPTGVFIGHGGAGPDVGSWEPTGERSLGMTVLLPLADPEAGFLGNITVRSSLEVSEDGRWVAGTYTVQFPTGPDGEPLGPFPAGEFGPADLTGERITVQPMGETVGPWPLPPLPEE
jgi:hypothetical protein